MFREKFLILTILSLLFSFYSKASSDINRFGSECSIYNQEYHYEYLYASDDTQSVFTRSLGKVNNFDNIKWSFVSIENKRETYYIKTSLFDNDYLCSLSRFDDFFHHRRIVMRLNTAKITNSSACEWRIKMITNSSQTYLIVNNLYNQPLYASSYIFQKRLLHNRNIYLWNSKMPVGSFKSNWIINCHKGNYLFS